MGHTKKWTTESRNFRTFLLMAQLEPETISRRIAQARLEAGLTQQELADLLSVHKRTIENYEHGRVPWKELHRIADYLHRPVEWFLYGDDRVDATALAERFEEQLALLAQESRKIAHDVSQILQLLGEGGNGQARRAPPKQR